jgi:hypothetical protein
METVRKLTRVALVGALGAAVLLLLRALMSGAAELSR